MEYKGISQHIDFCRLPTPGDRYELLQVLGVGTYGEVYKAKGINYTGLKFYEHKINKNLLISIFRQSYWETRCY